MKKLLLLALPLMMVGCRGLSPKKYVVVHHKNKCDTVITTSYAHYIDRRVANMHEGGSFTEVEYIKCIE